LCARLGKRGDPAVLICEVLALYGRHCPDLIGRKPGQKRGDFACEAHGDELSLLEI